MNVLNDDTPGAIGGGVLLWLRKPAGAGSAFVSPWDVAAVEEGGLVNGKPTCRVTVMRAGAMYTINAERAAVEIAAEWIAARRASAESMCLALLSDGARGSLEKSLQAHVDARLREVAGTGVTETVAGLLPGMINEHLTQMASGAPEELEPPANGGDGGGADSNGESGDGFGLAKEKKVDGPGEKRKKGK